MSSLTFTRAQLSMKLILLIAASTLLLALVACSGSPTPTPQPSSLPESPLQGTEFAKPTRTLDPSQTAEPEDTPEPTPTQGPLFVEYTVQYGDTLGALSQRFNLTVQELMKVNGLNDAHSLQIGQVLKIPAWVEKAGPDIKFIPDSELVYGPAYKDFDIRAVADKYGGYLSQYTERVEGTVMSGPQIVQLVAERFSVGPRALLTLLELQGRWVSSATLSGTQLDYPMGLVDPGRTGLYKQTAWAANKLNEGYYGKVYGHGGIMTFHDGTRARLAWGLNPGTAAIQNMLAQVSDWDEWQQLVSDAGFSATYRDLFGDPFDYEVKPLIPKSVAQPTLRLPLQDGKLWYFTGGPHAGWVDGSPWAAVDFAPADQAGSCWISTYWTVAAATGVITTAEHGRVVLDLDEDGFAGTGWALLYMHTGDEDRVEVGTHVKGSDHIGHPSCEGGAAQTSHLHFARLYNGQWIPAGDPRLPLVLSGWVFSQMQQEYDGTMTRGSEKREAENQRLENVNGVIPDGGKVGGGQ